MTAIEKTEPFIKQGKKSFPTVKFIANKIALNKLFKKNLKSGHLHTCNTLLVKQQPLETTPFTRSLMKCETITEDQSLKEFASKNNTACSSAKEEIPLRKYGLMH